MRKKIFVMGLSICLLAAACSGKNTAKDNVPNQSVGEEGGTQESGSGEEADSPGSGEDVSETKGEEGSPAIQELSKAPEVTFQDYSQSINGRDSDILVLSVTENCPIVTVEENREAERKINMVFEQQHDTNQEEIARKAEEAENVYKDLTEEEKSSWSGYGYGMSYKAVFVSTRILSIEAEMYEWQGGVHPNTWTTSYCFNAATGDLLYMAEVFTDEVKARKIVEQHILDTITEEPYKDALLDDYEDYVADVMTENTFYLNEKGLVVICNPYMVTAYAAGKIEIEIPYTELKDVMNEKYILK